MRLRKKKDRIVQHNQKKTAGLPEAINSIAQRKEIKNS
jgi:hypothetical protein